jgi:hypothetical protein
MQCVMPCTAMCNALTLGQQKAAASSAVACWFVLREKYCWLVADG